MAACLCLVLAAAGCTRTRADSPVGANGELTETQRRVEYFYYVYELAPCIRGLSFPVGEAPGLQEFLDQPQALAWSPWTAARWSASAAEIARARAICPPDPVWSQQRVVTNL